MKEMNPEIIYIHGAASGPKKKEKALVNSIREGLQTDFIVHTPEMPDPDNPDCLRWMDRLDALYHKIDAPVILIGHSLGASAILKYLTERVLENPLESVHLLAAPCWGLENWESGEFSLSEAGISTLEQWKLHFYHCEDDDIVPPNHMLFYKNLMSHAYTHSGQLGGHYFLENSEMLIDQVRSSVIQLLETK